LSKTRGESSETGKKEKYVSLLLTNSRKEQINTLARQQVVGKRGGHLLGELFLLTLYFASPFSLIRHK
jgi:hypothetical protein